MTTDSIGQGVRRMCLAADLEHYSRRTDAGQIEAQRAMTRLVREAGERGALERAQWLTQDRGDGELALLPPGIDEAHVITSMWRELREGLHRYNRHANSVARLRMRLAAHEGQTYVADQGFAGDAINTVCRLCDCDEVKDALSGAEGDLVLIVSDRIFYDVIRGHDAHDLPAAAFKEVTVSIPSKAFRAQAFIFSGDRTQGPGAGSGEQEAPTPAGPPPAGPPGAPAGRDTFNIAKMRDLNTGDVTHNHYARRDD